MPRGQVWPAILQCSPCNFSASMIPKTVSSDFSVSISFFVLHSLECTIDMTSANTGTATFRSLHLAASLPLMSTRNGHSG